MSKASNQFTAIGQVLGVYPYKKGKGGSYRIVFKTLARGFKPAVVDSYVFVTTNDELPEVNDVVEITGVLNVTSEQKNGEYVSQSTIIEETRGFLRKGEPRQRKATSEGNGSNNYNSAPQRRNYEAPAKEVRNMDDIPF